MARRNILSAFVLKSTGRTLRPLSSTNSVKARLAGCIRWKSRENFDQALLICRPILTNPHLQIRHLRPDVSLGTSREKLVSGVDRRTDWKRCMRSVSRITRRQHRAEFFSLIINQLEIPHTIQHRHFPVLRSGLRLFQRPSPGK
jgi:hypothetical protein